MDTFYVTTGIIIILIIISLVWLYKDDQQTEKILDKNYAVYLKTHKGIIKTSPKKTLDELIIIRSALDKYANGSCENLVPQIKEAINQLRTFNRNSVGQKATRYTTSTETGNTLDKLNPANNLCNVDLRGNIVHQDMLNSITPEPRDWESIYKNTLLEDQEEMDDLPINRLRYLIKNLDMTIELMRNNVCNYGELDLEALQNILIGLNRQICTTGKMHEPEIIYGKYPHTSYNRYDKVPYVPGIMRVDMSMEPFGSSRGSLHRSRQPNSYDYFENKNSITDEKGISEVSGGGIAKVEKRDIGNSVGDRLLNNNTKSNSIMTNVNSSVKKDVPDDPDDLALLDDGAFKFPQWTENAYDLLDSSYKDRVSSNSLRGNRNTVFQSEDRLKIVGDYSEVMENRLIGGPSVEGTGERDINGYRQPGHILSQLNSYDIPDMYTVNVGACGGKTVPDDQLVKECVAPTMSLLKALDGDPTEMLDCIDGNCTDARNYEKWYNQMGMSTAGMYSYGVDYYSPASIKDF